MPYLELLAVLPNTGKVIFLVVKQAAGAGLIARIKVCMDLSNVRTDAACEQRWNRCATPAQADIGGGMVTVATLIAPDETRGNNIFRRIYEDEEGSAQENVDELIDTSYVPYEPKINLPLLKALVTLGMTM